MTNDARVRRVAADRHRGARHRGAPRGEQGFTLVELMVVLVMFGVLLGMSVPIISTLLQTSARVSNTESNLNGQVLLSTNLQRLLRAAVAPAPPTTRTSTTPTKVHTKTTITKGRAPFVPGTLTPTSMVFYANVSTPTGPVRVTAKCTATPTHSYLCKPTGKFRMEITDPKRGTCPTKSDTQTKLCTYTQPTKTRTLVEVTHIQNGTDTTPLFEYSYGTQPSLGEPLTVKVVCATTLDVPAGCSGSDATTFSSSSSHCKPATKSLHPSVSSPYATCPAAEVDEVVYDVQVNAKTTARTKKQSTSLYGGLQVQDATGTFVSSSTSMLFNPAVG